MSEQVEIVYGCPHCGSVIDAEVAETIYTATAKLRERVAELEKAISLSVEWDAEQLRMMAGVDRPYDPEAYRAFVQRGIDAGKALRAALARKETNDEK